MKTTCKQVEGWLTCGGWSVPLCIPWELPGGAELIGKPRPVKFKLENWFTSDWRICGDPGISQSKLFCFSEQTNQNTELHPEEQQKAAQGSGRCGSSHGTAGLPAASSVLKQKNSHHCFNLSLCFTDPSWFDSSLYFHLQKKTKGFEGL